MILACILVIRHQHVLSFFFIYFLTNLLNYIASKGRRNWKGCEGSSCGLIWCIIPASASWTWGKSQSFLFNMASLWVEIWVRDLSSMKQAHYVFSRSFPFLFLAKLCCNIFQNCVQSVVITVELCESPYLYFWLSWRFCATLLLPNISLYFLHITIFRVAVCMLNI
jgi:hypothetical protein